MTQADVGAAATMVTILVLLVALAPVQDEALRAEKLLRQACEVVWEDATPYVIDRCTKRAMAALGDNDRLRDNELKRLLIDCERELEKHKNPK